MGANEQYCGILYAMYYLLARLLPVLFVCLLAATPSAGGIGPQRAYLPLVTTMPELPRSPFGFDLGILFNDQALDLAAAVQPGLIRAGVVLWSDIERARGESYHWERLRFVDQQVAAVRARGGEPLVVVQWAPAWARLYPDSPCGPIRTEHVASFRAFLRALTLRYSGVVRYWEVWNEPDFDHNFIDPRGGYGCWAEPGRTYSGGDRFGALLLAAATAIKEANPQARVISGSLANGYGEAPFSDFLDGVLASGAGNVIDMVGFHAYSDWRSSDILVRKVDYLRAVLARHGLAAKPLLLTEFAAICLSGSRCRSPLPVDLQLQQAHTAARLNAEVVALQLAGALWYTLIARPPGYEQSQLISFVDGVFQPQPAYFAFRNSALLLQDASATATRPRDLPFAEWGHVQQLHFRKPAADLYVLWVQRTRQPVQYSLKVPPGAPALCIERLEQDAPQVNDCSDSDGDGSIRRAVDEGPQFILVGG